MVGPAVCAAIRIYDSDTDFALPFAAADCLEYRYAENGFEVAGLL